METIDSMYRFSNEQELLSGPAIILPAGVPASNWIPTPSRAYYDSLYGSGANASSTIEAMIRMYAPQPGGEPPSILSDPTTGESTTYVLPAMVQEP